MLKAWSSNVGVMLLSVRLKQESMILPLDKDILNNIIKDLIKAFQSAFILNDKL